MTPPPPAWPRRTPRRLIRRPLALSALLAGVGMLSGCEWQREHNALKLIKPASMTGRVMDLFAGGDDDLKRDGRIHLAAKVDGLNGCPIQVWVIHPKSIDLTSEPGPGRRGTVVLLHPLLTSKSWFLPVGQTLARRGWDVVLLDLRAHGDSGGGYITWGVKEKVDLELVLDKLVEAGHVRPRVFAVGASMGAMVAVQYAALDKRCQGVLAFAPPASMKHAARKILWPALGDTVAEAVERAGLKAGFNPARADTVRAAQTLQCPLILVHGKLDVVVPYDQGRAVFDAAPNPKRMIPLPGHGHAAEMGRAEWIAERLEDLERMGGSPPTAPEGGDFTVPPGLGYD